MDRVTMTAEELETIQQELRQLQSVGRPEIAAQIGTAREWGDLKENAEYHAANEGQSHLETRIANLREQVRRTAVIQVTGSAEVVQHGSRVSYTDVNTNRNQTFTIVSPHDARPSEGTLSVASPVARGLIGRRVGEVIEVHTPTGVRRLSVDSIS